MIFFKKINLKNSSESQHSKKIKLLSTNNIEDDAHNSFFKIKNSYSFNEVKSNFEKNLLKWHLLGCKECHSAKLYNHSTPFEDNFVCNKCTQRKRLNASHYFKTHGPKNMPKELIEYPLSFVEEQIIALVYVNQYIMVRDKGVYASKGHCINFAQDISPIAQELPRLEEDIPIIIIRKKNSNLTFFDLKLRRKYISEWLNFLKYKSKIPGYNNMNINLNNLNLIPENGYLTKFREIQTEDDIKTIQNSLQSDYDILKTNSKSDILSESFNNSLNLEENPDDDDAEKTYQTGVVLPNNNLDSESTLINKLVSKSKFKNEPIKLPPILPFPSHSSIPLNEYSTAYLASMAFPTLFPYGSGDPFEIDEQFNRETFLEKVKHLIGYYEIINNRKKFRFAIHSRFILWIYNIQYRHATLNQGKFYLKQHPDHANLTIDQLKMKIENGDKSILKSIQRYMATIPGTSSFWFQLRCDLTSIIKSKGPPTAFFTLSFPTHYDPYLHEILKIPKNSSYNEIDSFLKEAPHIVNEYFIHKYNEFKLEWLEKRLKGLPEFGGWIWSRFEWQFRDVIHVHGLIRFGNGCFDCYEASEICIEGLY